MKVFFIASLIFLFSSCAAEESTQRSTMRSTQSSQSTSGLASSSGAYAPPLFPVPGTINVNGATYWIQATDPSKTAATMPTHIILNSIHYCASAQFIPLDPSASFASNRPHNIQVFSKNYGSSPASGSRTLPKTVNINNITYYSEGCSAI